MSTQESTYRPSPIAVLLSNLMSIAALILFAGIVYLAWPMLVAQFTGVAPAALPTAVVAPPQQPRPVSVPRPQAAPVQEAAPAAPMVEAAPPAYTQADAEATSIAAYEAAVQEAELNVAPLPNMSKEVVGPADAPVSGVNADWCRGAHLDDQECQPGNGSKVEK